MNSILSIALLFAVSFTICCGAPSTAPPRNSAVEALADTWCGQFTKAYASKDEKMKQTHAGFNAFCTALGSSISLKQYTAAVYNLTQSGEELHKECNQSLRNPKMVDTCRELSKYEA